MINVKTSSAWKHSSGSVQLDSGWSLVLTYIQQSGFSITETVGPISILFLILIPLFSKNSAERPAIAISKMKNLRLTLLNIILAAFSPIHLSSVDSALPFSVLFAIAFCDQNECEGFEKSSIETCRRSIWQRLPMGSYCYIVGRKG